MINPDIIFGRTGNRMFQMAALYSYAKSMGVDYYFQNPDYFDDCADEIRVLFSADIPNPTDKVSVHVRRAANPINPKEPKYSENSFYTKLCDTDYYERAIALFPDDNFLVITDDLDWCKTKWGNNPRFEFCDLKDLDAMNKMASCKAQIIANSSFSWWGAWLCPNYPNNLVVAPRNWYSDGVERTKTPSHWLRI